MFIEQQEKVIHAAERFRGVENDLMTTQYGKKFTKHVKRGAFTVMRFEFGRMLGMFDMLKEMGGVDDMKIDPRVYEAL